MALSALDRLRLFLRPAGRGVYVHSTGGGYAAELLQKLYGSTEAEKVYNGWEDSLQKIRRVKKILFGIPSDTGAGILRGANFGPLGIRVAYLDQYQQYPSDLLDIGDVLCVPQLLHDSMLALTQIQATRDALYPGVTDVLPVSPLSIAEAVYEALRELNPTAVVYLLGGDHSVSWPAIVDCHKRFGNSFGILHFDAHTDLLATRLGVQYCFATWAYHALQKVKPQHLVQLGVRTSAFPKEHWEGGLPVKQFWAKEINGNETEAIEKVISHFETREVKQIYISNDIDGTDADEAPATGTPEGNGLSQTFVKNMITSLGKHFEIIGADMVEVAPPLSGSRAFGKEKTCRLAAEYVQSFIQATR